MASQDDSGIPFSVVHDQQQFRLVELPPEILDIINTSPSSILSIKSAAPSTTSVASSSKPAYAVLCTQTQTYQLRQVQTSNSVYIVQPVSNSHGDSMSVDGLSAIATCPTTLELHPVSETAVPLLKDALPVYDMADIMVDAVGNGRSKVSVFSDVPMSDAQCEWAWCEVTAFEFAGSSFRPSAATVIKLWQSINLAALAEGIDLRKQFLTDDLLGFIDDEGYPVDLVHALFSRLKAEDDKGDTTWTSLDRSLTVPFVGRTLLTSEASNHEVNISTFLDSWKEMLPDSWRKYAELHAIEGLYVTPTPSTISIKGDEEETTGDGGKPVASNSRKWHERFARARKR